MVFRFSYCGYILIIKDRVIMKKMKIIVIQATGKILTGIAQITAIQMIKTTNMKRIKSLIFMKIYEDT